LERSKGGGKRGVMGGGQGGLRGFGRGGQGDQGDWGGGRGVGTFGVLFVVSKGTWVFDN